MESGVFKTKSEFCYEIGLSHSTFYRRCKEKGIVLSRKLLSPREQYEIKLRLGILVEDWPAHGRDNLTQTDT
jgi:hypothetical protein